MPRKKTKKEEYKPTLFKWTPAEERMIARAIRLAEEFMEKYGKGDAMARKPMVDKTKYTAWYKR